MKLSASVCERAREREEGAEGRVLIEDRKLSKRVKLLHNVCMSIEMNMIYNEKRDKGDAKSA